MAGAQNGNANKQVAEAMQQAGAATQKEMMYQPMDVTIGKLAEADLTPYLNRYTTGVIDESMKDLERQRLMQQNVGAQQASAANAFGGSRQGVAESLTNEAYLRQGGQLAADLRMRGFERAQDLALGDIQNQYMANVANREAGLSGSQFRLGAAQQLGGLADVGFGQARTVRQDLFEQAMREREMKQRQAELAAQQWRDRQAALTGQTQAIAGLIGSSPFPQTTTAARQPGLFDYLTLGATAMSGRRV